MKKVILTTILLSGTVVAYEPVTEAGDVRDTAITAYNAIPKLQTQLNDLAAVNTLQDGYITNNRGRIQALENTAYESVEANGYGIKVDSYAGKTGTTYTVGLSDALKTDLAGLAETNAKQDAHLTALQQQANTNTDTAVTAYNNTVKLRADMDGIAETNSQQDTYITNNRGRIQALENTAYETVVAGAGVTVTESNGEAGKRFTVGVSDTLTQQINTNTANLGALNSDVQNTKQQIGTIENAVAANTANIATNAGKIDTLEASIAKQNKALNSRIQRNYDANKARIADLRTAIHKESKKLRAGIAGANAMAMLPQPIRGGQKNVAVAVGQYGEKAAVAVGFSRASVNGKHIIKIGVNYDGNRVSTGGGYGYNW